MPRKVLLADDSITIQKVIELTFVETDYEVVSFANGDDALGQLDAVAPDLVIADIHMPGASGYDIARQVKANAPDTPVLLLVGTFEPFDEAEVEASGANGFLMKPFDSQELLLRVDEIGGGSTAAGAAEASDETSSAASADAAPPASGIEAAESGWAVDQASHSEVSVGVLDAEARIVEPQAEPAVEVALSAGSLSEEAVERIARRVGELVTPELILGIAREILPEVAEMVITERMRQLEEEVE